MVHHRDYRRLKNMYRFVLEIMEGRIVVSKKKKDIVVQELRERNYEAFPKVHDGKKTKTEDEENSDQEESEEAAASGGGAGDYDYLLSVGNPVLSVCWLDHH